MFNIMVYSIILISFFNVGFISVLQRLMHWVDEDVEGNDPYPWRKELVYAAYYLLVAVILIWLAKSANYMETTMILLNCQILIMISLTNSLKTLPGILTPVIVTFIIYGFTFPENINFQTIVSMFVFLGYLVFENRYFFPFDEHVLTRLMLKTVVGILFWLNVLLTTHISPALQVSVFISYVFTSVSNFLYMYVMRKEHIRNATNARDIYHDSMTDVRNWLAYSKEADAQFAAGKSHQDFGIIAMDIDHFKHINDTYGHTAGNQALLAFAETITTTLETEAPHNATLFRTGGEEFTIILTHTNEQEAVALAKKCQQAVRKITVTTEDGQTIKYTSSMGLTMMRADDESQHDVFRRADGYLYHSKRSGRDYLTTDNDQDV
ncbi:GGDEF domain-containing protein [Lacticaseibacillus zhaodongensis]|uniref:GGDEF domain-containing protein n=1 Tax=Lacticaseibacillus zhaodongensis TaxID=2668065 RepID=UPI0012D357B8|nr:GGDEF domain-containing protein [Lacticaseibacillus zhaodongensis]